MYVLKSLRVIPDALPPLHINHSLSPSLTITLCPKRHILVQCYQSFKTKQKSIYTKETVSSSGSYTSNLSPMLSVPFPRQTALCSGLFARVDGLVYPDTTCGRQRNALKYDWLYAQNSGHKKGPCFTVTYPMPHPKSLLPILLTCVVKKLTVPLTFLCRIELHPKHQMTSEPSVFSAIP